MDTAKRILWMIAPQVDYGPGGAMEIPGVSLLWSEWATLALMYDELWLSLETHPADHISFASMHPWRRPGQEIKIADKQLVLNITHCVAGSFGAMLSPDFNEMEFTRIFHFGHHKMEEPKFFFAAAELDDIDLITVEKIDLVGVNHLSLAEPSVTHLRDKGWPIELLKDQSYFPEN